jgi:glycosyltransferase involved in cell wall biosynthesis
VATYSGIAITIETRTSGIMPGLIKRTKSKLRYVFDASIEDLRDFVSAVRVVTRLRTPKSESCTEGQPCILVIDEMLPNPRYGAGYPRAEKVLQAITGFGWNVIMYPLIASPDDYESVRRIFDKVNFVRCCGERGLRRILRENIGQFQIVLVSRPETMAVFLRLVASIPKFLHTVRCVYDAEAIFTARERERRKLFGQPMSDEEFKAELTKEFAITHKADAVLMVNEADARLYRERLTVPAHVVSYAFPVAAAGPAFSERRDFLFVGRSEGPREWSPNVDSLVWFVEEIMPQLDALLGKDYRLIVAGIADKDVKARLASDRVTFLGIVDDLSGLYDRSRVFIAPTRFAAGIPIKLTEAAGAGIPAVATKLLVHQLGFENGRDIIGADDPETFAAGCALLYTDADAWLDMRQAVMAKATVNYSPEYFDSTVRAALWPLLPPNYRISQ